ncbi:MAG: hypothetical protein ACI4P6_00940, partial [Candidatus Spyradosoma sp.]
MAKAVRIRIASGGETHSSLESLLRNFCIEDVIPLVKSKRLYTWLEKRGNYDLKNELEGSELTINNSALRYCNLSCRFCSYFFKYSESPSIRDFFKGSKEGKGLMKFVYLLLRNDEYKKSARGVWEYSLPYIEDSYFHSWAKSDSKRLFESLKKYAVYRDQRRIKGVRFSENYYLLYWLALCYFHGYGTNKDFFEARKLLQSSKEMFELQITEDPQNSLASSMLPKIEKLLGNLEEEFSTGNRASKFKTLKESGSKDKKNSSEISKKPPSKVSKKVL